MTDIIWEAPPAAPASEPKRPKYSDIADELRAHPGEWAVVTEDGWTSMEHSIKNAGLAAFRPRGSFEARVVRTDGTQRGRVFARYLGEPTRPAEDDLHPDPPLLPSTPYEAKICREERERVARALEGHRQQIWNGGTRKVTGFNNAAAFVRGLG